MDLFLHLVAASYTYVHSHTFEVKICGDCLSPRKLYQEGVVTVGACLVGKEVKLTLIDNAVQADNVGMHHLRHDCHLLHEGLLEIVADGSLGHLDRHWHGLRSSYQHPLEHLPKLT